MRSAIRATTGPSFICWEISTDGWRKGYVTEALAQADFDAMQRRGIEPLTICRVDYIQVQPGNINLNICPPPLDNLVR